MKKAVTVLGLLICSAIASDTWARGGLEIVLEDGRVVEVPKSGPLHDPEAVELARAIKQSDKKIARLEKSTRGLVEKGQMDPEVAEATIQTATELRQLSASQLDLALRKAQTTSGFLDKLLIRSGLAYANSALEAAGGSATRLTVPTEITTDPPAAVLHRMLLGEYERKSGQWQSYTKGQLLRIGNYMFRASSRAEDGSLSEYREVVTVLADPTKQTIKIP